MSSKKVAHIFEEKERTEDVSMNNNVTFEQLILSKNTISGLTKCDFKKPSPIQQRGIPLGKCGFDLIVEAKSGTGKTAVFGIIALEMLSMDVGCQVLILAPTREIASQIGQVLTAIGSDYKGLKVEIVMGGTSLKSDIERLASGKYQILVGSPGRVRHLIKVNALSTESIRLFVLDEADKLMEESFQQDINYVFSQLPERKQVIAASATYTEDLRSFLGRYMRSPSHIRPQASSVLIGVSQKISIVAAHLNTVRQSKINFDELIKILSEVSFKQCLVFCNYQTRARTVYQMLCQKGWPTQYLASSQSQSERLLSLEKLQSYSCRVLVATDLAARGIDAANVDLVVNLDPPGEITTYLHRIGRAGRFGSKGVAITIIPEGKEETNFRSLIEGLSGINNNGIEKNEPESFFKEKPFKTNKLHDCKDSMNNVKACMPNQILTDEITRDEENNIESSDSHLEHLINFINLKLKSPKENYLNKIMTKTQHVVKSPMTMSDMISYCNGYYNNDGFYKLIKSNEKIKEIILEDNYSINSEESDSEPESDSQKVLSPTIPAVEILSNNEKYCDKYCDAKDFVSNTIKSDIKGNEISCGDEIQLDKILNKKQDCGGYVNKYKSLYEENIKRKCKKPTKYSKYEKSAEESYNNVLVTNFDNRYQEYLAWRSQLSFNAQRIQYYVYINTFLAMK